MHTWERTVEILYVMYRQWSAVCVWLGLWWESIAECRCVVDWYRARLARVCAIIPNHCVCYGTCVLVGQRGFRSIHRSIVVHWRAQTCCLTASWSLRPDFPLPTHSYRATCCLPGSRSRSTDRIWSELCSRRRLLMLHRLSVAAVGEWTCVLAVLFSRLLKFTLRSWYCCVYRLTLLIVLGEQCRLRLLRFYPRNAMLARIFATATCPSVRPSVCLSVCLSHAGIVTSRAKAGSWNVHHLIAPWF